MSKVWSQTISDSPENPKPGSTSTQSAQSGGDSVDTAATVNANNPLDATPDFQHQINPLSVQAASLVRSIDALSNIFWLCFLGFFLSIFFAGLAQLEDSAYTDYLYLGEYKVPKAILPLASLSFAVFAFWLVSNRLQMLSYVLGTTTLSNTVVRDLFHLNPPVLHVFDRVNENPWNPFSGVSVFVFIWSVFFGNAISLVWAGVVQQDAQLSEFDPVLMSVYAIAFIAVIVFGSRSVSPPLRAIINALHGSSFKVGWPRHVMAVIIVIGTVAVNEFDQFSSIIEQEDDLLGPAYANAIDGETLFIRGVEVNLFGIDAAERNQICQTQTGEDYACGQQATQALQEFVQSHEVTCLPLVSISERRILAMCELEDPDTSTLRARDFITGYRASSLSRLMIVNGHAVGVGAGLELYADEQLQAQTLRKGMWQGSFMPPRLWRNSN